MKCPECSANHSYSRGMTCDCGYAFALDPKRDGFADGRFLAAVRRASAEATQYFTPNQLVTELYRRQKAGSILFFAICAFLVAAVTVGISFQKGQTDILALSAFAGFFGIILLACYFTAKNVDVRKGLAALDKYERLKGPIQHRLRDDGPLAEPPPKWIEDDLFDYGVTGILFVEREILVDLFVLNRWHSENCMLVVSELGYPSYIAPRVNQLLDERPDLPLFALHDCGGHGEGLVSRLRSSTFFQLQDKKIEDISVRQEDLGRTPNLNRFSKGGSVPIDHLRWERLSGGLAQSVAGGIVLVDVIGRDPDERGQSFG